MEEGSTFSGKSCKFYINYSSDFDPAGAIYSIIRKKYCKVYAASTITSFRKRFNNHKSSGKRYVMVQRGIPGKHLSPHFYEADHERTGDMS